MALKPLFNKCLIEIIDDYEGVVRANSDEGVQKGILRDAQLMPDHITASTGYKIEAKETYAYELNKHVGKVVYWEQYGEAGNVLEKDGVKYALVPFYRLIALEDGDE